LGKFAEAETDLGESRLRPLFGSSRLTNRHTHPVVKTPGLIWGNSETCSFALMRFDTAATHPKVTFECITIDGEVLHSFDLHARSLRR